MRTRLTSTSPSKCLIPAARAPPDSFFVFRAPREGREPARSTERHELVKGLLRGPQRPIHRALAAGVWGSVQGPRPAWDSPQRGQLTPPPHLWEGAKGSRGCRQARRALRRHLPTAERPLPARPFRGAQASEDKHKTPNPARRPPDVGSSPAVPPLGLLAPGAFPQPGHTRHHPTAGP